MKLCACAMTARTMASPGRVWERVRISSGTSGSVMAAMLAAFQLAVCHSVTTIASERQFRIILPPCGGIPPPAHREVVMKAIQWIIAAAALSFVQPLQAAQSDPEVIIYRFPGVLDNGGGTFAGVATLFICTNFSGVTETIRFVTRSSGGGLLTNTTLFIDHLQTKKAATHG